MNTRQLVQGNEATALGAFYAGARFFAGYPITPSSEIAELCARDLPGLGGVYMQMEGAIIGASLAGAKAFTATSGPGFSLMQENLGVAIIGEVPVVVVNVQRVGPSTGLATKPAQADLMQMRWGRHGDQIVVTLMPATVQECFELMVEAFNLPHPGHLRARRDHGPPAGNLRRTRTRQPAGQVSAQAFSPAGTVRTIRFRLGRGRSAGLLW